MSDSLLDAHAPQPERRRSRQAASSAAGQPAPGWVSTREAAELLGVSAQAFTKLVAPLQIAAADRRDDGPGKPTWLRFRAIVDALIAHRVQAAAADMDAALLAGGNSPALERFREARAGQEQLKLEKMKGEMVYIADAQEVMQRFGMHFRRGLDKLRAWPRAHEVMSAAIDHAQRELDRWEPTREPATDETAATTPADEKTLKQHKGRRKDDTR